MSTKNSRKPLFIALAIVIVFILAAITGLSKLKARLNTATTMANPPLMVTTITVSNGKAQKTLPALATVKSAASIQIKCENAGKIIKLSVREGDKVAKGDLLAIIDSREQEAQLEAAQARTNVISNQILAMDSNLKSLNSQLTSLTSNFNFLTDELKRDEELFKAGAISASAVENSRNKKADAESKLLSIKSQIQAQKAQTSSLGSQKKASKNEVDLWEVRKGYGEIRASTDGIISARLQEEGNRVMPGSPIVTLEETSSMRLIMQFPQGTAQKIKIGQKILIPSLVDADFVVSRVYPGLNNLRQITIEAESSKTFDRLKFDMQIPVKIVYETATGVLVPESARFINFNNPEESYLFLITDSHARRISLKPILVDDSCCAVFSPQKLPANSVLAAGSYLENIRLPASFSVEVLK